MSAAAAGTAGTRSGPIDLRLAAGAGAAWLALLAVGQRNPLAVGMTAAVAAALAVVGASGRGRWAARIAGASACVVLVLGPLAVRGALAAGGPLEALATHAATVTLRLEIDDDPRVLAARGMAGTARVAVSTDALGFLVAGSVRAVDGRVLVLAPAAGWRDLLPGQTVQADGRLQPGLDGPAGGVVLFAEVPPASTGPPPWWQAAAGVVRSRLREAAHVLPPAESGLLPGLVDGDTSGLDPVLSARFRAAGLSHLVAVSGTNCSVVVGTVGLLLAQTRLGPRWRAAAGAAVLVAFVVIARPSPSVLRAAVMAAIALWAGISGRPKRAVPALAATTLGLLAWQPELAVDAGFAMSVFASGALVLIAPGWAAVLRRRRVPAGIAEAVAVAAAAHLVTAPVVAALHGTVSLVAIPANVLAEPAVAPATVLGFTCAALAPFWAAGAAALAWLAGWPCRWLVTVADSAGAVPGGVLPWPPGAAGALTLAALAIALCLIGRRGRVGRLVVAAAVVAALVRVPAAVVSIGWPPSGWDLVACDIGQGDGLVLPTGRPGSAVVVDTGPQPGPIDRCLSDLRIRSVPALILTHFHLDHVGGVLGVLHDRAVGRVLVGPLAEPASGVDLVRQPVENRSIAVTQAVVGEQLDIGQLRLTVLGPAAAMHDTRSDPNNSSIVLRADVSGVRILLPGDAEIEEQDALLRAGADIRADVLKVPHHGSAYSDPSFLAATRAAVGVISVGLHNDYGHPSPVLLAEMAKLAVPLRRTDLDGDVAVTGDRGHLRAVVRGPTDPALQAAAAARPAIAAGPRSPDSPVAAAVVEARPGAVAELPAPWAPGAARARCRPHPCRGHPP